MLNGDIHDTGAWLPPGQTPTKKFPIVGESKPSEEAFNQVRWRLHVVGLVERPLELTYAEVMHYPQQDRLVDIHCVTGWSQRGMRFTGFPLALLLRDAVVKPEARFVRFEAYSPRKHDTSLPLALALDDSWLVHLVDGKPLAVNHGWPLRVLTPKTYFYKSLKWLHVIELMEDDKTGYWEKGGYSNSADPWVGDDRYVTGSLDPRKLEILRVGSVVAIASIGNKVILSADLRDWNPACRDLRGIVLKNCDLRGAYLAGVDLRGANLSNSNLQKADLSGASLRTADVEGADFSGANLNGVDLRDTALSATKFFTVQPDGTVLGAEVSGMLWQRSQALLEIYEEYLSARQSPI